MIASITLTGFMAHARTVIPLCEGVTVLTGPNNTGKSAVVEALRCVAHNPPPKHFIRHGDKSASVELLLDDGLTVTWVRKPASAVYRLQRPDAEEPETFAKLGQGKVPEDIEALVRLAKVALDEDVSKNPVDVHIGNQREPVFLINQAGTVLASFMAGATEAAYLVLMQKRLADRLRKAQAEARTLRAERQRHLARLDGLAPLPDLGIRLFSLGQALDAAGRELDILDDAESRLAAAALLRTQLAWQRRRAAVLTSLAPPPAHQPTAPLAALADNLRQAQQSLDHGLLRARALAALADPPAQAATRDLSRLADALEASASGLSRLTAVSAALSLLQAPPEPAPVTRLGALGDGLRAWSATLARHAARQQGLSTLTPPPELSAVAPVMAMADRITRARLSLRRATRLHEALLPLAPLPEMADASRLTAQLAALSAARERLASAEAALARAKAAEKASHERVQARLAEVGSCPLCAATLQVEDFLRRKPAREQP